MSVELVETKVQKYHVLTHHWVAGAMLDDQLWHQALVMDRVLESLCGSEQGPNDAMMWTLLRRGVIDANVVDKPWDGFT